MSSTNENYLASNTVYENTGLGMSSNIKEFENLNNSNGYISEDKNDEKSPQKVKKDVKIIKKENCISVNLPEMVENINTSLESREILGNLVPCSSTKPKDPKELVSLFPKEKESLQKLKNQKSVENSEIFTENQKKGENLVKTELTAEDLVFYNSLPSTCLCILKPPKDKSTTLIISLPTIKNLAIKALTSILSKRPERFIFKNTWKIFCLFTSNYSKKRTERLWKNYQMLSRMMYLDAGLGDGPLYAQGIREALELIKEHESEEICENVYRKASQAYDVVAHPPFKKLGYLLVLAWRFLKGKDFLVDSTLDGIKKPENDIEFKKKLLNIEIEDRKALMNWRSLVSNKKIRVSSPENLIKNEDIESLKSSDEKDSVKSSKGLINTEDIKYLHADEESSIDSSETLIKNEDTENLEGMNLIESVKNKNLTENSLKIQEIYQNSVQNQETGQNSQSECQKIIEKSLSNQEWTKNFVTTQKRDQSSQLNHTESPNLNPYPNVNQLLDIFNFNYSPQWKSTVIFPFPFPKFRNLAIRCLWRILKTRNVKKTVNQFVDAIKFFTGTRYTKKSDSYVWLTYHRLSRIIYVNFKLGKGPIYVERLQKIYTVLLREQFNVIPKYLYEEIIEAYKVLADSANEEIELLISLAQQYLKEEKIFNKGEEKFQKPLESWKAYQNSMEYETSQNLKKYSLENQEICRNTSEKQSEFAGKSEKYPKFFV